MRVCFYYYLDPCLLYLYCFDSLNYDSRILSFVFSCMLERGQFSILFEVVFPFLKREWEAFESAGDVSVEEVQLYKGKLAADGHCFLCSSRQS